MMSFKLIFIMGLIMASIVQHLRESHGPHRWPWRYKTYGNPEHAETLVLIPGLDGCTSFYTDVTPELTVNYHVVLFYLPLARNPRLYGSDDTITSPYSFDTMAAQLVEVLDELELGAVHLIGESFGGVVAQHVALSSPDRVKTMTIISSLCRTELTTKVKLKAKVLLPIVETVGVAFPGMAQFLFAALHVDDVVESFEPTWVKDFFVKEASWVHHYSVTARIRLVIGLDMCEKTKQIQHQTLLVYGREDNFTLPGTMELYSNLPKAKLLDLPGGHLPHLTEPKAFAAAVHDFVSQSSG